MAYQIILLLLAASPEFAAGLPSFFIPNTGQMDAAIRYFVQTPDLRAGFSADAAVFQMHDLSLRIRFAGANSQATIVGVDRLTAQANFLIGNRPENWSTHVPLYREIRYRNLYPGIDVTYAGVGPRIKSEFLVGPGADPNSIRLEYSSADNVALDIDSSGALVVRGEHISAREEPPVVYQESSSGRVRIAGRYALRDGLTVGFEIGAYDRALPLIIDPVLSYATYLGGSGLGAVTGVAVDSFGDLYATGWTEATNFPVVGPVQASNQGNVDVFIAKLNAAGSALEYATYIGGNGDDRAAGIAVDGSGLVYVTGSTASTNFPLVTPVSSTLGGGRDAFALKLNASGTALVYSTYLGGTNTDSGTAIAVDASGNAYFAGDTMSANFPVLHAVQPVLGGGTDSFLVKLTSAGAISFSTFLGGAGNEHSGGVAVDSSDNVYIAGGTTSTNFPVVGSIQAVNGGGENAFLAKINSTGTAIVYSTYLGGSGGGGGAGASEEANGVAVDASGNAYLAGVTNSANFPVTIGALQTSYNGVQDAFAAKVNAAGNALVYSTYLGGSSFNWISGLAVSSIGNIYVAGYTSSPDFPTVAPIQTGFNGLYDAFVSEINATGNALVFSTYLWRHGRGCGQRDRARFQCQHVRGRADQFAEPASGRPYSVRQHGRQHGMAGADRRDGSAAADSFGGVGLALLGQREFGDAHGPVLGSRRRGGVDRGRAAGEHHGFLRLRLPGDLHSLHQPVRTGQRRGLLGIVSRQSGWRDGAERPVHLERSDQFRDHRRERPDDCRLSDISTQLRGGYDGLPLRVRRQFEHRICGARDMDRYGGAAPAHQYLCLAQCQPGIEPNLHLRVFRYSESVEYHWNGDAVQHLAGDHQPMLPCRGSQCRDHLPAL